MFFPEKIKNIKPEDKVLEIGPGSLPFARADVFLEKQFTEKEALEQRGLSNKIKLNKPIFYYEDGKFPFKDKEFDYVICSHVIEHIDDVSFFVKEMTRVAKNGYIEYPTIYYEYLYNFKVHKNFVKKQKDTLYWTPKKDTPFLFFQNVQTFFYKKLLYNQENSIERFKEIYFEGFEWHNKLETQKTPSIDFLTFTENELEYFFKNKKNKKQNKKLWQKIIEKLILIKNNIKKIL